MNMFFRGVVIFMGFVWITLPFIEFDHAKHLWQPVISVLLGLIVLRSFLVKPILERYRIRQNFAVPESVQIEIGNAGIFVSENGMNIERPWEQLLGIMPTSEGIVFYWTDKTKNWLPANTLGSEDTIEGITKFIKYKMMEECQEP